LQVQIITDLLSESQHFVRQVEGDPSVVSLRDVQRCLRCVYTTALHIHLPKLPKKAFCCADEHLLITPHHAFVVAACWCGS
jgi:hypothetical protein